MAKDSKHEASIPNPALQAETMATITRNGVRLAYDDRGAAEPIIVFVHGWTCDRWFFAPQVEHFARRHRVVSVDLRGHGESDKPSGPYSIGVYADDIAYLIDQLGLGKEWRSATVRAVSRCCSWPHQRECVRQPKSRRNSYGCTSRRGCAVRRRLGQRSERVRLDRSR